MPLDARGHGFHSGALILSLFPFRLMGLAIGSLESWRCWRGSGGRRAIVGGRGGLVCQPSIADFACDEFSYHAAASTLVLSLGMRSIAMFATCSSFVPGRRFNGDRVQKATNTAISLSLPRLRPRFGRFSRGESPKGNEVIC